MNTMTSKEIRPQANRAADPREEAKRRAAEIRGDGGLDFSDNVDEFNSPNPPDGWSYEWKRKMTMNQEDITNMNHCLRTGWTPVPISRHPEMMQAGAVGVVERKGMVLMERPSEITEEVQRSEARKARAAVKQKDGLSSDKGMLGREDSFVKPSIKQSFEPMPIPEK